MDGARALGIGVIGALICRTIDQRNLNSGAANTHQPHHFWVRIIQLSLWATPNLGAFFVCCS